MHKTFVSAAAILLAAALVIVTGCSSDSTAPGQSAADILVYVTPAGSLGMLVGSTAEYTATVLHDAGKAGVTWALSGAGCTGSACGSLTVLTDSAVDYTAPPSAPIPATVILTATSVTNHAKSASAAIAITMPAGVTVSVSATPGTVDVGAGAVFTATVFGDPSNGGVRWTATGAGCSGPACGTISPASSASGDAVIYSAPAAAPIPAAISVTATSIANPSAFATDAILVALPILVSLTPAGVIGANAGTSRDFVATEINDTSNAGVNWSVIDCSGACGTLSATHSASGVPVTYTAPASAPTPNFIGVRAASAADSQRFVVATIVVTTPGVVSVAVLPRYARLCLGGVYSWMCPAGRYLVPPKLTAYVFNDSTNAGVVWSWYNGAVGTVSPTTSASGVPVQFRAGGTAGTSYQYAKSVADPSKQGMATVQVCKPTRTTRC